MEQLLTCFSPARLQVERASPPADLIEQTAFRLSSNHGLWRIERWPTTTRW